MSPSTSDLEFIYFHEDTSADHLTRFSILKNTELPNTAVVLEWCLILRLAGNVGISEHLGKPKPFPNDCLVTENQKKHSKCCSFLNFLRDIKDQVFTFYVFTKCFYVIALKRCF